jgi:uncharacterized protein (UPF0212 family)
MHTPTAQELLEVWERALAEPVAVRALELVALCDPDASREALLAMRVGERDRRLIGLRSALFGSVFSSLARCPACGEACELSFDASEITVSMPEVPVSLEVVVGSVRTRFRAPTSGDCVAVSRLTNPDRARRALLERCVLSHENTVQDGVSDAQEILQTAIAQKMAEADPQALIELALSCPACAHRWSAIFDIASYLWRELDAWARRTLREVHKLARAYGWSEAQVLALSPTRRRLYLELVNA